MTVTTTSSSVVVQGNGVLTTFSYSFLIPSSNQSSTDQTWSTLTYTDANGNQTILASNLWSITGVGSPSGGTFTYSISGTPIATGTTLTLQRNLPYTQLTNLTNQSSFNASTIMGMDDYVTMLTQQLLTDQEKSIQFPAVDSTSLNPILPAAAVRAGLILGFDSNGNVQVSAGTPGPAGPAGATFPIAAGGGTANAITATFSPALTLTDQTICAVVATAANTTTTPTFAPNGLTAHTITKSGGVALLPADIPNALAVIFLEYNLAHTRWELMNPATNQDPWIVAAGSADAITATYLPAITALTDGLTLQFRASAANATTTPTFAPNGLTAYTITKKGGSPLVAGDIPAALAECIIVYNLANTRWELLNPSVSSGAGSGGGLVLLATANVSGAANVSFSNTYITNAYNKYVIQFDSMTANVGANDIYLLVSTNNGSSYLASNYVWGVQQVADSSGSSSNFGSTSDTQLNLSAGTSFGGNNSPIQGNVIFASPSASAVCMFMWNYVRQQSAMTIAGGGYNSTTTPINNIQLLPSGTATISGNFHLMGILGK